MEQKTNFKQQLKIISLTILLHQLTLELLTYISTAIDLKIEDKPKDKIIIDIIEILKNKNEKELEEFENIIKSNIQQLNISKDNNKKENINNINTHNNDEDSLTNKIKTINLQNKGNKYKKKKELYSNVKGQ